MILDGRHTRTDWTKRDADLLCWLVPAFHTASCSPASADGLSQRSSEYLLESSHSLPRCLPLVEFYINDINTIGLIEEILAAPLDLSALIILLCRYLMSSAWPIKAKQPILSETKQNLRVYIYIYIFKNVFIIQFLFLNKPTQELDFTLQIRNWAMQQRFG